MWVTIKGNDESEFHWMHGNAYLMTDSGKTVKMFSALAISPDEAVTVPWECKT